MNLHFEWDDEKANSNLKKHGVSFAEAMSVFNDELSLTIADELHAVAEYRLIDVGMSSRGRMLVVVYTERGDVVRIISARKANKREIKDYEENR